MVVKAFTKAGWQDDTGADIVEETEVVHNTVVPGRADRVRLMAVSNDRRQKNFYIQFSFGRLGHGGAFEPTHLNDGIVIGGPNYSELDFNSDGVITEDELLRMCAQIMGWDGSMVELETAPIIHEGA